jgi:mono/diheme cytochrome c family protein
VRERKSVVVFLVIAFCLWLALPAFADDGAGIYKAKCAACHGADGAGKMGPKLAGTSLSADQITDLLTKGDDARKAPHKKPVSLPADDAKAVAGYVKSLK